MAPTLSRSAARAARIIRYTPGITRAELAAQLDVAVTTVNPLVAQLIDGGLVAEQDLPRSQRGMGRPRAGLVARGDQATFGAVIWSHGVLDTALAGFDGRIRWRERQSIDVLPRDTEIFRAVESIVARAQRTEAVRTPGALVLGLPAPYERGVGVAGGVAGELSERSFTNWFGSDPMSILEGRFSIPVIVENDANLGALGETADGAAHAKRCVIYVKLSDHGIGSGIVVEGSLLRGSHGFAGEIAHVRVDDNSPLLCSCGSRGCLEGKLGPALLTPFADIYGADFSYARLLELAAENVPGPVRVLQDAGRTAGRALADMSTYLNPDMIVIDAGSVAGSEIVIRGIAEQVESSAPPFIRRSLALQPSALGEDAAIAGALQLARTTSIERPATSRPREGAATRQARAKP